MFVSCHKLQHNFSRAAVAYDARAEFQHAQTHRVMDAALMLLPEQASILDIGCGTGYFAHAARQQRPHWRILGLDIAFGMCAQARARCAVLQADAAQLPLADTCVDAVVSSLCYQWVGDLPAAMAELARVLKPGGSAIIACLGEGSLAELRACAEVVAQPLPLLAMPVFGALRAAIAASGLAVTLADQRHEVRHYPHVTALMDSMRRIGAGNSGAPQFIAPKRWAALVAAYKAQRTPRGIPATWEHQFFVLHKPI